MPEEPPTVDQFAARYRPHNLATTLDARPELWADIDRLHVEHGLGWERVAEYLTLHGIEASESGVRKLWNKRQTR